MKNKIKRLAAMMIAVMMMLTVMSATAQAPQHHMRKDVLAGGKNIATEMQIGLDQATLMSLLTMFGQADVQGDAGQQVVFDTLFGALNKLKMKSIQSPTAAYITIGTDKGVLMDIYADTDIASGDAFMTTSVMPNIKFTLPKDMLGSYGNVAQTHTMEMISQWFAPYSALFEQFSNTQQTEKATVETGTFDMADWGSFDQKSSIDVDTYLLAALLEEFLPLLKEDKVLPDHLALVKESDLAQTNDITNNVKSYQDYIAELEAGLAKMKSEPNEMKAKLELFSDSKTENKYWQAELIDKAVPFALVSFGTQSVPQGNDIHLSILMNQAEPTAEVVQAVDWAALRGDIQAGANTQGLLLDLTATQQKLEAENKALMNVKVNAFAAGINLGFMIDGSSTLSGAYESASSFALNVFSPLPLITMTTKSSQTDEALPVKSFEGFEEVQLSQTMSEKDTQMLTDKLMASYPDLLEKLKVVLPEEAAMLTLILAGALNEQAPQTPQTPPTVAP